MQAHRSFDGLPTNTSLLSAYPFALHGARFFVPLSLFDVELDQYWHLSSPCWAWGTTVTCDVCDSGLWIGGM